MISAADLDYLKEMATIAAGNAATALTQLLGQTIDINIPSIKAVPASDIPAIIGDPNERIVCARSGLLGDVEGEAMFFLKELRKLRLIRLVETATPLPADREERADPATIGEVANITFGAYFTVISRFCGLNIYHRPPITSVTTPRDLADSLFSPSRNAIILTTHFKIPDGEFFCPFLIVPTPETFSTLLSSVGTARARMTGETEGSA